MGVCTVGFEVLTQIMNYKSVYRTALLVVENAEGPKHTVEWSFFFAVALRPNAGHGLLILEVSRSHTTTHHSR